MVMYFVKIRNSFLKIVNKCSYDIV